MATRTKRKAEPPETDRRLATTLETSRAPALSRAMAVLRVLGESATPLGVQAIARELGLVPSTCFYLLKALVAEELVVFDADTKRYAVGPGVLTLAQYWFRRHRFPELVQPHLDRIGNAFDATVVGAQIIGPHGGDARTLAVAQAIDEDVRGFVAPP